MRLGKLVRKLRRFDRIAVVGPQRSGTNVATVILAEELGYQAIRENNLSRYPSTFVELALFGSAKPVVVQATSVTERCHLFPASVAVVYMMRNLDDIQASQRRIKWSAEAKFRHFQSILMDRRGRECLKKRPGSLAELRYLCWKWQKKLLKNPYELEYESLSGSPLWIPKEERQDFYMLQVMKEEDGNGRVQWNA